MSARYFCEICGTEIFHKVREHGKDRKGNWADDQAIHILHSEVGGLSLRVKIRRDIDQYNNAEHVCTDCFEKCVREGDCIYGTEEAKCKRYGSGYDDYER